MTTGSVITTVFFLCKRLHKLSSILDFMLFIILAAVSAIYLHHGHMIQAVSVTSLIIIIIFFLCKRLRSASSVPRTLMTITQTARNRYPGIRPNLQGMALKEEIDKFIDFCLTEQAVNPRDEEFDVAQLHASAGRHSAIGLLLSTRSEALNNLTPIEHAEELALAARTQFKARRNAQDIHEGDEADLLDKLTLDKYPAYTPDQDLQDAVVYWEDLAVDRTSPYQDVVMAQDMAAQIRDEISREERLHNNRSPEEKLDWMRSQPQWERTADYIEACVTRDFKRRQLSRQEHERHYRKFNHAQFKRPEDFHALRWLRDHIIERVGAITEFHAEKFRSRRMCLGETPMEAVAKLLDDADVLSKAGLYDFHPYSEVYRIISKKDLPGGPFFTKALYETIEHIIRYQIAQRPEISKDPQQMIVIWRDTAQREFDFVTGRDNDLDANSARVVVLHLGGVPRF